MGVGLELAVDVEVAELDSEADEEVDKEADEEALTDGDGDAGP